MREQQSRAGDHISCSHRESCDIEGIRQFWDAALKRLKAHAERAAPQIRRTTVTNPDLTRRIEGDEEQPG
jgi:hypothetical protein